jgi:AAA domain, putative AbiEii toxin, Type IV TA system
MTQDVLLHGFGLSGYRSFSGSEIQRIGPMSKIHLVAGRNNAGKSNVLAIAQRGLPALANGGGDFAEGDVPLGSDLRESPLQIEVAVPMTEAERDELVPPRLRIRGRIDELLADTQGQFWFRYELTQDSPERQARFLLSSVLRAEFIRLVSDRMSISALAEASLEMTSSSSSDPGQNAFAILSNIVQRTELNRRLPSVATISAFRQIGPGTGEALSDGHDGPGLIDRLRELQSPSSFNAEEQERRFSAINQFVATLFDDPAARIQAANDGSTIYVYQNGRRLPLENYGTGVHEVIIMAAAATVLSQHLVCIEEPEIHLHPTLQRKLLTYLHEETDNQYLIATHSAHLLDTGRASISAVSMQKGRTVVAPVVEPRDVATLSAELGLRASDLVQANAVVWVEGPSDRTYLRRWLSLVDDELIEGEHFSIMFYGGALLSELSPKDPSVEEFVSLPRINRNFSIVIDSDRRKAEDEINATKQRVATAFEKEGVRGVVWVTAGYTIENYVPADLLRAAVEKVHSKSEYVTDAAGRFENPLGQGRFGKRTAGADKGAVAREIVALWDADTEWPLDLEERVQALAAAIREVNDLPPKDYGLKS